MNLDSWMMQEHGKLPKDVRDPAYVVVAISEIEYRLQKLRNELAESTRIYEAYSAAEKIFAQIDS